MTREQMKSLFTIHTNGQDEWIRVDKRIYKKAIDKFCDAHEAEIEELRNTIDRFVEEAAMYRNALDRNKETYEAKLKAKEEKHGDELQALLNDMGRAISKLSGELKAKDEELGVAKKVAQDAYILGVSQAAEMDRFWSAFGLLDENISVDDVITFFKAKEKLIATQSSVIIACQNAILQKDEHITKLETERDKYNTIAANLQISRQKAYDNIVELEAIIEKMKCCGNCKSYTNVGSKCLLDMEDSLDCRTNNYSNWKLKDNE